MINVNRTFGISNSTFISILMALMVLFSISSGHAISEGELSLGAQFGNIALKESVGASYGSALGYGAALDYAATDEILFHLGYLLSDHNGLDHSELNVGVNYYFSNFEVIYTKLLGGVSFMSNDITAPDIDGSGMAIYTGLGADMALGEKMRIGLNFHYNFTFEVNKTTQTNQVVKVVEDNLAVMLTLMFTVAGSDSF